ncbi:MAG: hypothetical protein WAL56_18015 [Candidatus Sulfotelmatobacter sp.]
MDRFTSLVANRGRETDRPLPYSAQEWDATSRIANSTALGVTGRNLSQKELKRGAALVHHVTAGVAGSLYGAMVYGSIGIEQSRIMSGLAGLCFGASVWYLGDELLLPALGILKREAYTAAMRTEALVAHLTYGVATGLSYRQLMATSSKAE